MRYFCTVLMVVSGTTIFGDGPARGVQSYLFGKPDHPKSLWQELGSTDTWTDAAVQAFFSLDVAVWTTYGSYRKLDAPIVENVVKFIAFDTCYALLAGIPMFCFIGYLDEINFPRHGGGLELLFVSMPSVI